MKLQRTVSVLQKRDCRCKNVCDGSPTPYPLDSEIDLNEVGKHCLNQGKSNGDEDGVCRFLYWRTIKEI